MQANLAMDGQYMEAHDIDSKINKQIENKELIEQRTNEITSHMKKKSSTHKIITNTWVEHGHRISTYGNRRQNVLSGKEKKNACAR